MVYGAYANKVPNLIPTGIGGNLIQHGSIDRLDEIYRDLKAGNDDRGEIWNMWNEGVFKLGCLRPCMYNHQFSLLNRKLHLNTVQR